MVHDVLQQADFRFSCDYAFLSLNKSRHASSSVKICILVIYTSVEHNVATSVHVATGKQETVKEAQVCNESIKGIASTVEYK